MRGMQIESQIASEMLGMKDVVSELAGDLAERFNIKQISIEHGMKQNLLDAIKYDKKVRSGKITVQVVDRPGSCRNVVVGVDKYLEALNKWLKEN
jgi:3-dehydroquinate synthetase